MDRRRTRTADFGAQTVRTYDACLLCLALERYQADTEAEAEALARLRFRFAKGIPYAPFQTAEDWHDRQSA